jgi:hypothetical protein
MRHRETIRRFFMSQGRSYSIAEAASLLSWPVPRLRAELSSQYLIPEEAWETTAVPWSAVAVLALSEWSYLRIEEALGDDADILPKLVRLQGVYVRLPGYQLAVIRAAARQEGLSVDEFLARHFVDLACEVAPSLSSDLVGFREAFHWPSSAARTDNEVTLVAGSIA